MKKILILSNHFITLYNFRRELIRTLIEENNEVFISMPKSDENKFFSDMGCKIIETDIDRRGINPLKDLKLIANYIKIMKTNKYIYQQLLHILFVCYLIIKFLLIYQIMNLLLD